LTRNDAACGLGCYHFEMNSIPDLQAWSGTYSDAPSRDASTLRMKGLWPYSEIHRADHRCKRDWPVVCYFPAPDNRLRKQEIKGACYQMATNMIHLEPAKPSSLG